MMKRMMLTVFMMLLTVLPVSCGSGKKSSKSQGAPANPAVPVWPSTCLNLAAQMDICAREDRDGKRIRMEVIKSWIQEDCEQLGRKNPKQQARLLECVQVDCSRLGECLAGFLREKEK